MKKIFVLSLFLTWFMATGYSQYTTPGTGVSWSLDDLVNNSNGAVTASDQDYLIHEDLVISLQDTIKMLDNTTVKFDGGVLITVKGILLVDPPDSIYFTAMDTLFTYKSFRFEDSDGSQLKKCRIEFGGGIDIVESDILVEDCIFKKNDKSNSTGVIDLFFSNAQIQDCEFYDNQGPAVMSGANAQSSPLIAGNMIRRNNTVNANMPQINLGTSSPGVPILITGNTIEGYYDKSGGIAVTTLAGGNLDCVIDSNLIYNNRYGITAYGYNITSVISNNTIYGNNIEDLPMQGGSGINYWGGTSNTSLVFGNEIWGNLWGITVTGEAMPNFGQVDPDTINPGRNRIFDNGNLGVVYALYNNTPNDLFAENNFWGSWDLDSVEQVIFHQPDDETLGFVDYLPIMDSLTTAVNTNPDRMSLSLFPNPASNYICIQKPALFKDMENLSGRIYDAAGRETGTFQFNGQVAKADLTEYGAGVYFIEISGKNVTQISKFIKH